MSKTKYEFTNEDVLDCIQYALLGGAVGAGVGYGIELATGAPIQFITSTVTSAFGLYAAMDLKKIRYELEHEQ